MMVQKNVNINSSGKWNHYTALHIAIYHNQVEVIQTLLELGADPYIKGHCKLMK